MVDIVPTRDLQKSNEPAKQLGQKSVDIEKVCSWQEEERARERGSVLGEGEQRVWEPLQIVRKHT